MALQTTVRIQCLTDINTPKPSPQSSTFAHLPTHNPTNFITLSSKFNHFSPAKSNPQSIKLNASNSSHRSVEIVSDDEDEEEQEKSKKIEDSELMNEEERKEWRKKIREVINNNSDIDEVTNPEERKRKMAELLSEYPLVVDEEDPNWPEDADGWGFNLGQFFDKISIKNVPKDDDKEDYDSDEEIVWKDDDYIRPIKEITTEEWEETVFKDISPLVVFVHNRYRRPKENDMVREELEKVAHIFWNCGLPSPRCVAVDAVIEVELVSSLNVVVFPEVLFTKAGKILYREKGFRTADELSKIMGFFYYGAAKPSCLGNVGESREMIPPAPVISE